MEDITIDKKKEFISKLKALLKEYNASIGFTCSDCSDTYCIYDEAISFEIGGHRVLDVRGWWIEEGDIRLKDIKR